MLFSHRNGTSQSAESRDRTACDVVAAALIVAAAVAALNTTHDLKWPFDFDHWRDIAQAQTVRDGHPLADPYFRGEWAWYNPLVAWVVATGALLSGASPAMVHVQAGPYLNLLGPIAFYVLMRRIARPDAAVAALAMYLFFVLRDDEPSWAYATYSPWLFPGNFAQGFFFVGMLALVAAAERPARTTSAVAGAVLGMTFLAHTAPAIILGVIALVLFAARPRSLATIGAAAGLVAAPFIFCIGVHYHFHVLNRAPLTWEYDRVTLGALPRTLFAQGALIAAGVAGLFARPIRQRRALATWLGTAFVLMLLNTWAFARWLPAFHFWLYTTAACAALAGCTIAWLCRSPRIVVGLVVAACVWNWSTYANRGDFRLGRQQALARDENLSRAADRLHSTTRPDDVVLGNDLAVLFVIGPAGRKVVAGLEVFSNPYVASAPRRADRDRLLEAIDHRDRSTLERLTKAYGVTKVLSLGERECTAAATLLGVEWRSGEICISAIR